ncbi:hypothetical protein ONA91_00085 [Micromonospora sp. DR5-3]|uniref:hypothetical protein n=1 Tax=unclassified Micromonospora TaxID=2617518 RepID=UPI0011D8159F|nr:MULTISPECIES: hypothetical protein [unclassified Micromonospora]MCW3812855.1 hypothetical protein [Micromonospora sp. DR5-3]TYC26135.1 hypothetical protein FXF52_01885 [Micromonospora sp. MP36]
MTQATGSAGTVRRTLGTVAAMLAATTLLGGCGPKNDAAPGNGSATSPTANPKQALLDAVPDEAAGAFRFTGKDASSDLSGRIDPASKAMEMNMAMPPEDGVTVKMSFLVIEDQVWMKAKFSGRPGLPKLPDKWMALDRTKLTDGGGVPSYDGADQGNAGPLIDAATSVEQQGPGKYAGVIDVTGGEAVKALDEGEAAALGEAGKQVPFTALVGPDGHLSSLVLEMPAAGGRKAYQYVVAYTDFGSTPKITAPTGSAVTKAPALAYELLNI